jgi:hypothetical protein
MMATIAVNVSVQVSGGPQISVPPQKIEVEAYEKFEFKFKHEKDKDRQEETFAVGSGVEVLLIKSNLGELKTEKKPKITYKIGDPAASSASGGASAQPSEIVLSSANLYLKDNFAVFGSGDRQMTVTVDFTGTADKPADIGTPSTGGGTDVGVTPPDGKALFKEMVMVEVLVGRNIASS